MEIIFRRCSVDYVIKILLRAGKSQLLIQFNRLIQINDTIYGRENYLRILYLF
jgi:hypothetical protein